MEVFPLRFRRRSDNQILFSNEAGQFFLSDDAFLHRLTKDQLSKPDQSFLLSRSLASETAGDRYETAFLSRLSRKLKPPKKLSYVILIPTLRCNLSCSYCQVSRAQENAVGYDWNDETLAKVLKFLDETGGDTIQIEFQGGEPTLRPDILSAVISFCRNRFSKPKFVICTNLSTLPTELLDIFSGSDVFISTSLDGPVAIHEAQRTEGAGETEAFYTHLRTLCDLYPERVSALPTLDPENLPSPSELIDAYDSFNMRSIYLRPIVFHGFARKLHPSSRNPHQVWQKFYETTVREMIVRNAHSSTNPYDEFYLTYVISRLVGSGADTHVDLRSPNWLGYDHLVIDYDGVLYPTDEARMMARTDQIDLSIGNMDTGFDLAKRDSLQGRAFNGLDPWCSQCVYQAACGSDPIDDLARTGIADPPRPASSFCKRHMHIFDFAIDLIFSSDPLVQSSLAKWLDLPTPVQLGDVHHDPN